MSKSKILIVEDEPLVAHQLQQNLQSQGYEVSVALNGEKALQQIKQSTPSLALLDIMLPGSIDGIALAERLQVQNIPVIYITGYSDDQLFSRARRTEPLAYLVKPLKINELSRVVDLAMFKRDQEIAREGEKQQQAHALHDSEERFRRVLEQVTDYSIFTLDLDGCVNSWNSGAERNIGYSAEQITGKRFDILFTEADRKLDVPAQEMKHALSEGSAGDTRWLLRSNGEKYWSEGVLTAIRDEKGAVTGFSTISRDSTKRRRMEEQLAERDERLRVALHAARTGTWRWDLRTNIDTVDDSLRKLFGLLPDQEIRTIEDFYAIIHPDERSLVIESFQRTLRDGVHLDVEFRVLWPDGSEHWLLDQGEVGRDAEGRPAYFAGACVDITDRKQAEKSVKEHEERFRLYVANMRDYALLQLDAEGRITGWNKGAESVLGYSEPEALGQHLRLIFTPEDNALGEAEKEIEQARVSGRSTDDRWQIRKGAIRFWATGVLTAIYDERGRLRGFAKVMRDETERRLANERLRSSLKEKEVLLQEIHHRVKNNLQVITSLLRLQSEHTHDEHTKGMFEEARNRVQAIGGIHELLYRSPDLAHIDFNAYLTRLSRELVSFYRLSEDGIHLTINVDNAKLDIDQAIPCGLLVNELVTNSLKHAFPDVLGGSVTVSLDCGPEQCLLMVEDDGVGLPRDFNWQSADSLGLQLVQVLTNQLRGKIHVESNPGTRVRIEFRRSDA